MGCSRVPARAEALDEDLCAKSRQHDQQGDDEANNCDGRRCTRCVVHYIAFRARNFDHVRLYQDLVILLHLNPGNENRGSDPDKA